MSVEARQRITKRTKVGRRAFLTRQYVRIMGCECANPECESGLYCEGHHIRPLFRGGPDKFWNLVCLCRCCHDEKGIHDLVGEDTLIQYKTAQEIRRLGFFMDENDEKGEFWGKYYAFLREMGWQDDPDLNSVQSDPE